MSEINAFSDRDCERIADVVRRVENKVGIPFGKRPPPLLENFTGSRHFKAPSGGIAAFNTTTLLMPAASCVEYSCDSAGQLTVMATSETIYNPGDAVTANKFFVAVLNERGLLVVAQGRAGIIDIRVSGTELQYTFDGTTWTTWHTGTACP